LIILKHQNILIFKYQIVLKYHPILMHMNALLQVGHPGKQKTGIFSIMRNTIFSLCGISSYRRDNKPRVGILILPKHQQQKSISDE